MQAAYRLGFDRVLSDPTDDAICLAAAETALGRWPVEGLDRHLCERIVEAYELGLVCNCRPEHNEGRAS